MPGTLTAAPNRASLAAAAALRTVLPHLIALSLEARQAHWNLAGRDALVLRRATVELSTSAQQLADALAERARALGFAVEARPRTVAAVAAESPFGPVDGRETAAELGGTVEGTLAIAHDVLVELAEADPITTDVLVGVVRSLERLLRRLRSACAGNVDPSTRDAAGDNGRCARGIDVP